MAREEHEREDLLHEATAYAERIELEFPADHESVQRVFVGFRRDGSASFYFGDDPVYHFNTQNELRRAHVDGLLVKAERGKLATLERRRTGGQVQLIRQDLDAQQTQDFLQRANDDLQRLRKAIVDGETRISGQVPADGDILGRVAAWLANLSQIVPAQLPGVA